MIINMNISVFQELAHSSLGLNEDEIVHDIGVNMWEIYIPYYAS